MNMRKLKDVGIAPWPAVLLLILAFSAGSIYLFQRVSFAPYVYTLLSLSITVKLSSSNRNEFLQLIFRRSDYILVRLLENIICALPFLIFLLIKQNGLMCFMLTLASALLALNQFESKIRLSLPTPFSHKPFEFSTGFRYTFFFFPLAWILTALACRTHNHALGVFSVLFVQGIVCSYYGKPEHEYFVWSYALKPMQFLFRKVVIALQFTSCLLLPQVLALAFYFPRELGTLLIVLVIGYGFLLCIILAKYAAYPGDINLVSGLLIACCLYFPPLLILLIPYFFRKAKLSLKSYLS